MRLSIFLVLALLLAACNSNKDHERIIGKWYSEDFWFEFHDGETYSGGRGPIVSQKKAPYALETEDKKLTFYTNKEDESYYLIYGFEGEDTLVLTNSMNITAVPAKYIRKK